MQVCMHRGANQIGGSCAELKYKQHRLIVDLGLPLDAAGSQLENFPDTLNLMPEGEERLSAIVSHAHIDHYDLAHHLPAETEIYIGKVAQRIIQASIPFTGQPDIKLQSKTFLADRQAFNIGDFQVTPFLVDHSAYMEECLR